MGVVTEEGGWLATPSTPPGSAPGGGHGLAGIYEPFVKE